MLKSLSSSFFVYFDYPRILANFWTIYLVLKDDITSQRSLSAECLSMCTLYYFAL